MNSRLYLNAVGAIILIVGLTGAAFIYRTAGNEAGTVLGYEQGNDGTIYPVRPEDSKKYQRDLEIYGGKANVLADDLRRWVVGLWQGKPLAYNVALIAILISAGFFYAANHKQSNGT